MGLQIYSFPLSVLPLSECWLLFLNQLPSMARGRFDGSFQAHFFPASSPESKGCLCINSKKDSHWLKLITCGSLRPITGGTWWLAQLGHMLIHVNWLAIPIPTRSWKRNISEIKGRFFCDEGRYAEQVDKRIVPFRVPLSSLWKWIWEMIKISVKVKMKKLVLKVRDIREILQKIKMGIEVFCGWYKGSIYADSNINIPLKVPAIVSCDHLCSRHSPECSEAGLINGLHLSSLLEYCCSFVEYSQCRTRN